MKNVNKMLISLAVLLMAGVVFAGSSGLSNGVRPDSQPGFGDNSLQNKAKTFNESVVTWADTSETRLDTLDGGTAGALVQDDISANGTASHTLHITCPVDNKTNTIYVTIYNALDNREYVFKVEGTNDVGNTVRWFQEKVVIADNTQATEDSQIVGTMLVGGATTTVYTINSSGVTFAGTVAGTTFSGSGASLTALPAASLTGNINHSRISAIGVLTNANIGAEVQAYDADLTTYAGITPGTGGKAILALASYGALRTNATLVVGTDVQAYDADLTTYGGITPSAAIQTLLGSASAGACRTNIGLATASLQTTNLAGVVWNRVAVGDTTGTLHFVNGLLESLSVP